MKLKTSLYSRRKFLNGLLAGGLGSLVASLLYPLLRSVIPPYKEPDEVRLPGADFNGLEPGDVRPFAWDIKPGFIKKNSDGTFTAFVGVCTHLDCNVSYVPAEKKFFCACHDGWYDADGRNIAGPPPTPLRRLTVVAEGAELVIRKETPA
ncbi:MAG: ubiquinol-cytochrome c reductase iron-sulfur subunit [Candidatus Aminicenantes bacterium]|nr:ubiquinol-cytochrome c reductase iron-sulfur subunit [Candidatus Aminicenantes bacterium]